MRQVTTALALVLLFLIAQGVQADVWTAGTTEYDWSGFGTLEAVALKPFAPTTLDLGAGVDLQLTTIPANWWLVGGRKVFATGAMLLSGDVAWGGCISLQPAAIDDSFRLGILYNADTGAQAFLGKSFAFNW